MYIVYVIKLFQKYKLKNNAVLKIFMSEGSSSCSFKFSSSDDSFELFGSCQSLSYPFSSYSESASAKTSPRTSSDVYKRCRDAILNFTVLTSEVSGI